MDLPVPSFYRNPILPTNSSCQRNMAQHSTAAKSAEMHLVAGEQHLRSFLSNLNTLRTQKTLCDIEIECQGKIISAHKAVLAASIDYFQVMFRVDMIEAKLPKIEIKEINFTGMEALIEFAYTYEIRITEENIRNLLHASNFLGVKFVKDGCESFLMNRISVDNCLELRDLADQQSCEILLAAIDTFLLANFMELSNDQNFIGLDSVETLERIFASDDLNVDEEKQLFDFAIRWVEHSPTVRLQHLPNLLRHIRFLQFPLSYFLRQVRRSPLIAQSAESTAVIREITDAFLGVVSTNRTSSSSQTNRKPSLPGSPLLCNLISPELDGLQNAAIKSRPRKVCAGTIFCVGGRGPKLDPFRSVEVYDWLKNEWHLVGKLKIGRRHVGVVCVLDKVYAIGGHDGIEHLDAVECLDIRTGIWREVAPLEVRRRGMAVGSLGGAIYAIGGLDDQNCYRTVERYDIELDKWTHVCDMNVPRGGVAVATFENQLFAIGGNSGTCSLDTCERYDPILDKWLPIAPMKNRRAGCGVAVVGEFLYVIGGFDDDSPLNSCERYSFATNEWSDIPSLSCARGGVGVTAMGGRIFAIGGHDSKSYLNTVEAFDMITDQWTEVAPINQRRAGAGVTWSSCSVKEIGFLDNQNLHIDDF